jgi:Xaa-Pro aminopeptidase
MVKFDDFTPSRTVNFAERIRRLRTAMAAPSLLLTHLPDVRYLCGFTGSNAALAVTPEQAVLFTDGRYTTQAREQTVGARVRIAKRPGISALKEAVEHLAGTGVEQIAYDPAQTTVAMLDTIEQALPGKRTASARRRFLKPLAESPVAALRLIKDAEELAKMETAALTGCRIFDALLPHIEPGIPEREIAAELEFFARSFGADAMSFETIVASGPRSALPHGHASDQPLPRRGFLTLDFGVILGGYCSDMTRTVHLGRAGNDEQFAYDAVLGAQQAAVDRVRAGVSCAEVDEAARSVLRRAKLAKYFTHSTGHGVGIEIHEAPRIGAKQTQVLEPGMVITIEPGVYLPGKFGIRIEDTVVVEEHGCRVLTPTTKALIEL